MTAFGTQLSRISTNNPEIKHTYGALCAVGGEFPGNVLLLGDKHGKYIPTAPFSGFENVTMLVTAMVRDTGISAWLHLVQQVNCDALVLPTSGLPSEPVCYQPISAYLDIKTETTLRVDANFVPFSEVDRIMRRSGSSKQRRDVAQYALRKSFPDYFRFEPPQHSD